MDEKIKEELEAMDAVLTRIRPLSIEAKQRVLAWLQSYVNQEQQQKWIEESKSKFPTLGVNG